MRVLITGGAGFIGSHLCDAFHTRGDDIWCVDNLLLGTKDNVFHLLSSPRFHFHQMDVLDRPSLEHLFQEGNFDSVFHLAANSDIQKGSSDRQTDFQLTFLTTVEILEAMFRHRVQRLFFASSSAVFGENSKKMSEEDGPLRPISFYGASKLAAEAFISVFSNNFGVRSSIMRFPNVVGPRSTHGVIFDFISRLSKNQDELTVLGDGSQKKPYLHVSDLLKAMLLVYDRPCGQFDVYHASNEDQITVGEIVEVVLEEMDLPSCRVKYTGGDRGWPGDVPQFQYDIAKLKSLGWKYTYNSKEAVRKAVRDILAEQKGRG